MENFEENKKDISELMVATRKQAGLTQVDIARKMRVSQPYIAKIEKFKKNIGVVHMMRYFAACGKCVEFKLK